MTELNELEIKVRADDPGILAQVLGMLGAMDGVTVIQYSCPRCESTDPAQHPERGGIATFCAHPFHQRQ